jgi:hypothetical protein
MQLLSKLPLMSPSKLAHSLTQQVQPHELLQHFEPCHPMSEFQVNLTMNLLKL